MESHQTMKKLISAFAILGVIGIAGLMSGCGGSDHDDNGPAPAAGFAPASVANQSVTLTENGQSRDIQFAVNGNTFTQFENGTTNAIGTGTFSYTQQGGNNAQLILTVTDNTGTNQVTYVMNFTSASAGTYTFSSTGGQAGSGTFSNLQTITSGNTGGGNTGGGNTGGGNTGGGDTGGGNTGGGNTGGGNTGETPTTVAARVIDFSATGQGNERLTFASTGSSVTSDVVTGAGNYTFTPGTGGAPATLVVTFPNGDTYNLTMTFTDATHGTWGGSQHYDNADHPVPAGSAFTIQP